MTLGWSLVSIQFLIGKPVIVSVLMVELSRFGARVAEIILDLMALSLKTTLDKHQDAY